MVTTEAVRKVKQFINERWAKTIREPSSQKENEVPLPFPFTVPTESAWYHIFYYWDTYYASLGLVLDGRVESAKHNADNMLHLIETLGYVPNMNVKKDLNRSQPPHAALQVKLVYERTRDRAWLEHAFAPLVQEYAFWAAQRLTASGLNGYDHHGDPRAVAEFLGTAQRRLANVSDEPVERMRELRHALAVAESGWDFTPRWDYRCADHNPVDLNSLLFAHENILAEFADELGNGQGALWRGRAAERRALLNELCWDEEQGFLYDYDVRGRCRSPWETGAVFYALWAGWASPEQAVRLAGNMDRVEFPHGITCVRPGLPRRQPHQWDHPCGWAPIQWAAIAGLRRYGLEAEARRVAEKYVNLVTTNFNATGCLWERYNVVSGGIDVPGDNQTEAKMPAMLGWTAGVFLAACEYLGL
jgi:alpha,alpha-trehalase